MRFFSILFILELAMMTLLTSCSGTTGTEPEPKEPNEPEEPAVTTGTLEVTISTSGKTLDDDGYELSLDGANAQGGWFG